MRAKVRLSRDLSVSGILDKLLFEDMDGWAHLFWCARVTQIPDHDDWRDIIF